jgi:hypothetical protein
MTRSFTDRERELLKAMSLLPQPFTTRDVIAVAAVRSSVQHFMAVFTKLKFIKPDGLRLKHNQPQTYCRTDKFPDMTDEPVAEKEPAPILKRTPIEEAYWQMRDSFNIKTRADDPTIYE